MSNVVKLDPEFVGEDYRFEPDQILDAAKGQGFSSLAVVGVLKDGTTWASGTGSAGETLILMERAKRQIVFGED